MNVWQRIRNFLAPPVFADNEGKTREAGLLNTIVLGLLVTAVPYALSTALFQPEAGSALAVVGAVAAFEVAIFILLRVGQVRLASWIQITALFLIVTFSVATFGGVASPGSVGYVIIILMAGLLVGGPAAFAVTA